MEYRARDELLQMGYPYVMRAAASKGAADLAAFGPGGVLLVQVKSGEARLTQEERYKLASLAGLLPGNVRVECWHWRGRKEGWERTGFATVGETRIVATNDVVFVG